MLTRALLVVVLFFVLAPPIVCRFETFFPLLDRAQLCSQLVVTILHLTCCNFSTSESEALAQTPLKTDDVASLMQMIKELQDSVQPRAPTPITNWPGKFARVILFCRGWEEGY